MEVTERKKTKKSSMNVIILTQTIDKNNWLDENNVFTKN
tara:strand:+ start:26 stop:142 length:117 start_codon:yes stop_codon:yes gene_type:complete